jgi:hypothetical protein
MLRNIAALVTLGLVALSHVSAIPVPGGDDNYRPDRYEHDYKPHARGVRSSTSSCINASVRTVSSGTIFMPLVHQMF